MMNAASHEEYSTKRESDEPTKKTISTLQQRSIANRSGTPLCKNLTKNNPCPFLRPTQEHMRANRQLVAKAQRTTCHLFVLVSPAGQQTCSHLMSPARAEENVCINYQTSSTLARATNDMSNCDHYQASPAWAPIYCHLQRQKKTFASITTSSLARAGNDTSNCNHHEALPACTNTDCCPGP